MNAVPTDLNSRFDLVSVGEVMLRLAPAPGGRLSGSRQLDVEVAGSQFNVAADLAHFGATTAFVTKLPANDLSKLVHRVAASHGVDMSNTVQLPEGRLGLNFVELGPNPVPTVVYDRQSSAASTISPDDFDWERLARSTKIVHTDGILLGLSNSAQNATLDLLTTAQSHDRVTSFDINYRAHLWTQNEARTAMERALPMVDILVTNPSASEQIFGFTGSTEEMCIQYRESFGCESVLVTSRHRHGTRRGLWRVHALIGDETLSAEREYVIHDRFGTGDAFLAGYLYGFLRNWPAEQRVRFSTAACALAHSIGGDVATFTASEIERFMQADGPILER